LVTICIAAVENKAKEEATKPLFLEVNSEENNDIIDNRLTALVITDTKAPKFSIHKNIICHYSPYFSAAFNGNFVEGKTQRMTLDVDEKAFGVLVNWFYNQVVTSEVGARPPLVTLAKVWMMAEEFLIPELQDQVMDEMFKTCKGPGCIQGFGEFTQIADTHGNGDNPLVDLGVWILTWCCKEFADHHIDKIPRAIVIKAFQHFKQAHQPAHDKTAKATRKATDFYVTKDNKE
jgi:hypothetical protein